MKLSNLVTLLRCVHFAGVFSFILFFLLAVCWRTISDAILKSQLKFNPTSILYNVWLKNDIPIYLEIYLYNITNVEDFQKNKSTKLNFAEVGPFVFREYREKVDVIWDDFQETVTFNQTRTWQFLPEISEDLNVKVTNINPIAATIAYISRLWESNLQKQIANTLLNLYEPLFVTATALEWTFEGIPDEFLNIFEVLRNVTEIPIPYNKFGWFYERNGSAVFDGAFRMKTGKSSIYDLGMMVEWNYQNKTEHYVDECAEVYGSTGEIIPPLKNFQSSLSVFASDICSYITLKMSKIVDHEGIKAYEFIGDKSVFDNGTLYSENLCFYIDESVPSGTRNVSSCRFGSPAFISFPHFLLADSYYSNKLTGLNPDEKKHKFSLKIEPKTGMPLQVDAAFQINFLIQPYEWCDEFRGVPKMYIPMLWFKQYAEISGDYINVIKTVLFVQNNGGYFVFAYATLVLFSLLVFSAWQKAAKTNKGHLTLSGS